jgi:hypothetical protein
LANGFQETGTWAVSASAPTGAPQVQAQGAISFPVQLKKGTTVKPVYRTTVQSENPVAPCLGMPIEPRAAAGNLCVYRSEGDKGGLETQDQNTTFHAILNENGVDTAIENKVGELGAAVVFRSTENSPSFKEEPGEEPGIITHAAYSQAMGTWAVTEK